MSFASLVNVTAETPLTPVLITRLCKLNLLRCFDLKCNEHGIALELAQADSVQDGYHMICHRCRTGKKVSIRQGSWFSKRHHTIVACIQAINLLNGHAATAYIVQAAHIGRESVYNISNDLTTKMARYNKEHKPFWQGRDIVEIDECYMKWKVDHSEAGCIEECKEGEGDWLIGLVERRSGQCWIEPIENRNQRSMIPLIRSMVAPGIIIMTDAHETYKLLDAEYEHHVINKAREGFSRYGRTRSTVINVNMCEGMWKHLREFSHAKSYSITTSVHRIVHEFIFAKSKLPYLELVKIEK